MKRAIFLAGAAALALFGLVVIFTGALVQASDFVDISPDEITIEKSPVDDSEEFYLFDVNWGEYKMSVHPESLYPVELKQLSENDPRGENVLSMIPERECPPLSISRLPSEMRDSAEICIALAQAALAKDAQRPFMGESARDTLQNVAELRFQVEDPDGTGGFFIMWEHRYRGELLEVQVSYADDNTFYELTSEGSGFRFETIPTPENAYFVEASMSDEGLAVQVTETDVTRLPDQSAVMEFLRGAVHRALRAASSGAEETPQDVLTLLQEADAFLASSPELASYDLLN